MTSTAPNAFVASLRAGTARDIERRVARYLAAGYMTEADVASVRALVATGDTDAACDALVAAETAAGLE